MKRYLWCALALLAVAVAAFFARPHLAPSRALAEQDAICAAAQEAVREAIDTPATAQFSPCAGLDLVRFGDGRALVTGPVDFQNEYGALVRHTFNVLLVPDGAGGLRPDAQGVIFLD